MAGPVGPNQNIPSNSFSNPPSSLETVEKHLHELQEKIQNGSISDSQVTKELSTIWNELQNTGEVQKLSPQDQQELTIRAQNELKNIEDSPQKATLILQHFIESVRETPHSSNPLDDFSRKLRDIDDQFKRDVPDTKPKSKEWNPFEPMPIPPAPNPIDPAKPTPDDMKGPDIKELEKRVQELIEREQNLPSDPKERAKNDGFINSQALLILSDAFVVAVMGGRDSMRGDMQKISDIRVLLNTNRLEGLKQLQNFLKAHE